MPESLLRTARGVQLRRRSASLAFAVLIAGTLSACGSMTTEEPATTGTPAAEAAAQPSSTATKSKRSAAPRKAKRTSLAPTTKRAAVAKREAPERPRTAPSLSTKKSPASETVHVDNGLRIALGALRTSKVKAETPGEVAGSAVVVKVAISNRGSKPIDLDSAVVSLTADKGELGIPTTAGDPKALQGDLRPGDRAHGTYVFMLDPAANRSVKVSVNYAAGAPVAAFTGRTTR